LCRDWAAENEAVVEATDTKFLHYKTYLKGQLSSQLLCRLSAPPSKDTPAESNAPQVDFWSLLGVEDEFDRSYIVAQIERFSLLYNIRSIPIDEIDGMYSGEIESPVDPTSAAAAAGIAVSPSGVIYMDPTVASAAAAAAAASVADDMSGRLSKKQASEVSKAHRLAKDAEKALDSERRLCMKREQRRLANMKRQEKLREREHFLIRKASERAQREAAREERRRKKLEIRMEREKFAQEQKEAAMRRAADLVASNRVPIEITRGAQAAKAAASAAIAAGNVVSAPPVAPLADLSQKKSRSAVVVSTAADLHQIVTHSKNLFAKYNAVAKEHNQKVNWITVSRELGIHVKVREKYARMHQRAEQRGFDWEKNGHIKIKDRPDIFLEPTPAEQKAKMPPPPPDINTTVLIHDNKEVNDAVIAAATVVDAVGVHTQPVDTLVPPTEEQTAAAAAVAATLVHDPTAGLIEGDDSCRIDSI
jgi:hypothetical protein